MVCWLIQLNNLIKICQARKWAKLEESERTKLKEKSWLTLPEICSRKKELNCLKSNLLVERVAFNTWIFGDLWPGACAEVGLL